MQKLLLVVSVFLIVCIYSGASYGNDVRQTDVQISEELMLRMKKLHMYEDRETLNINRLVKAVWHQNGASIVIITLDDKGNSDDADKDFIYLWFHHYHEGYGYGGRKSHIGEKFIKQINNKLSKGVPLINFIQKDLIVTLEYADGDTVVFDAYIK